jgi:hypothetical protein
LDTKVVLDQTVLLGSPSSNVQRVATVYIDGREYRVSAPPGAKGDALDWFPHLAVTQQVDINTEIEIHDALGVLALKVAKEELEQQKRASSRKKGMHPDGVHCAAQICLKGHVQHCDGMPFKVKTHCTKCGAACIDECTRCKEPIRGVPTYRHASVYSRPQFCHGCGRPYPWMEDLLSTARELLDHDDKLSLDDRTNLWGDLQYVMSNPKADLVPAKKKLIDIKLEKATGYVRDALLDLIAKTTAEVLKG